MSTTVTHRPTLRRNLTYLWITEISTHSACVSWLWQGQFILSPLLRGAEPRGVWVWLGCSSKPSRSSWGNMVPGGREGEPAAEMAPFCSLFLEEQSSAHNPWGVDTEQGSQCSQCHADNVAWEVCPSLFLVVWGLGKKDTGCKSIRHTFVSRKACSCWAVVTSTILSLS